MEFSKASPQVQSMFARISRTYDLANTILSFGIHHYWRRRLVNSLAPHTQGLCLDICTGTADLAIALESRFERVIGCDFCQEMLDIGRLKAEKRHSKIELLCCDALHLPFASESADVITIAFGVRNFQDLKKGLRELRRVLKTSGQLRILEFGQPTGLFGLVYSVYSKRIMPFIGGIISGDRYAYSYLPETAKRFPAGSEFIEILKDSGFNSPKAIRLTGGIAYLYTA